MKKWLLITSMVCLNVMVLQFTREMYALMTVNFIQVRQKKQFITQWQGMELDGALSLIKESSLERR